MLRLKNFLTRTENPVWQDLAFIVATFGISSYFLLGRIPLLHPDEGRYAEIPREMLERGDFITPTLNYVKYFEKPPLHYWLNALSFTCFGQNGFGARFAGATCGLLVIVLCLLLGRKLFDRRSGLYAALMLGTSLGFVVQARINLTDMTLTFFLCAALGFFLVASREGERCKTIYFYLFYVCAALAVLAKGLIGIVLPIAVIGCYILVTRRWRLLREMRLPSGLALFLVVAAPWFVAVSLRNPEFPQFFFIHEHFERYLTTVHQRYQPPWFFFPILLGVMLPWSFFIPAAVKGIWRERSTSQGDIRLFLVLWAVVIFSFFSKSNSKLIPYILPVFPALAVLVGAKFASMHDDDIHQVKRAVQVVGGLFVTLGCGVAMYPYVISEPQLSAPPGIILGFLFVCGGLAALIVLRKKTVSVLVGVLGLSAYLLTIVAPQLILPDVAGRKSVKQLAMIVKRRACANTVVASYGYEQDFPFYIQRRVIVVNGLGELEFGSKQGDQTSWFMNAARFGQLWDSPAPLLALLHQNDLELFTKSVGTPITELGREGDRVLITNRQ